MCNKKERKKISGNPNFAAEADYFNLARSNDDICINMWIQGWCEQRKYQER